MAVAPDQASELIPDHAVAAGEDDLFDHGDFVDRLVAVIEASSARANIALFGNWGSGKTGISNALSHRLATEPSLKEKYRYVYFDAFKYARKPLLRKFLYKIAGTLDPERADELRSSLYEQKSDASLADLSDATKTRFKSWALTGLKLAGGAALVLGALLFVSEGRLHQTILDVATIFIATLIPSGLLGVLLAFGAQYLTVTTTREIPSTEEEFEQLFEELLTGSGIDGQTSPSLVVFIDELDRCAPEEVVETLESLKTFLDQPGCVFVVAADQRVLEHALTQKVRQSTPPDIANPYYSAGSAYLDKIFQYQLPLPPLMPRRLTEFAVGLLADRGGAWTHIDDPADVVSILVPVHVRSPRRVKVLLNAFIQTFTVALAREARGKLTDVAERAPELAKLVCLRTEFPLFAAELASHPDLPKLVLRCSELLERGESPLEAGELRGIPADRIERAIGYAIGTLPTDQLLGDAFSSWRVARHGGDTAAEDGDGSAEGEEIGVAEVDDDQPNGETGPEDSRSSLVSRSQSSDLVHYLHQASRVRGPSLDLIHLESRGHLHDLDEEIAHSLEALAIANRADEAAELVGGLAERDARNALLYLADLVRDSRGFDAQNAVSALLCSAAASSASIADIAGRMIVPVRDLDQQRGLAAEELPAALHLSVAASDDALASSILGRDEALEDPLRLVALNLADQLVDAHAPRLGQLLVRAVIEDPADAAGVLA